MCYLQLTSLLRPRFFLFDGSSTRSSSKTWVQGDPRCPNLAGFNWPALAGSVFGPQVTPMPFRSSHKTLVVLPRSMRANTRFMSALLVNHLYPILGALIFVPHHPTEKQIYSCLHTSPLMHLFTLLCGVPHNLHQASRTQSQ